MAKTLLTDRLWAAMQPILPPPRAYPKGGRPRIPDRQCLKGILFVLKTGIAWEDLPKAMGCGSGMTCWRRLRDWQEAGVWQDIHQVLLNQLQAAGLIDWSRVVADSANVRAVFGGRRLAPTLRIAAKAGRSITCSQTQTAFHWRPCSRRRTAMTSRN